MPAISSKTFLLLGFIVLLLARLPVILFNAEINPDESQMLTQAITLSKVNWVWGVAVDGTTSGPLNSYLLWFSHLLGFPLNYVLAHFISTLLALLSWAIIYRFCQILTNTISAQIASVVTLLFLAITQHADLVSYNSESLALLLISICGLQLAKIYTSKQFNILNISIFSLCASMIPFAKIQAIFIIFGLGLILILMMVVRKSALRVYLQLGLAALLFPLLFLGILWYNDVLSYFLQHYIIGNSVIRRFGLVDCSILMEDSISFKDSIISIWTGTKQSRDLMLLLLNVVVVLAVGLTFNKFNNRLQIGNYVVEIANPDQQKVSNFREVYLIATLFILILTLYSIGKPATSRVHYYLFLLPSVTLLMSLCYQDRLQIGSYKVGILNPPKKSLIFIITFLILGQVANLYLRYQQTGGINLYPSTKTVSSDLGKIISKYAHQNEPICIWGWACKYHVELQLPQATRQNHSILQTIENYTFREKYLEEYTQELARNKPSVIIDAVGKSSTLIQNQVKYSLEKQKDIKKLLDIYYSKLPIKPDDCTIYIRKDRL